MKIHVLILIPLLFVFGFGCGNGTASDDVKPTPNILTTRLRAAEALRYCMENEFDTSYCILVDMSLHSGVSRFFMWDFSKDTILYGFPVGHGCCDNPWSGDYSKNNPSFSNKDGSHCTSLGKYKVGERGYSEWGVHVKYLLHGLEPTNNNALKRQIVFHSWDAVSDVDVYPSGIPEGWGCPTLSNNNFKLIDPVIKKLEKPVLFWIYR